MKMLSLPGCAHMPGRPMAKLSAVQRNLTQVACFSEALASVKYWRSYYNASTCMQDRLELVSFSLSHVLQIAAVTIIQNKQNFCGVHREIPESAHT